MTNKVPDFLIMPNPGDHSLTTSVTGMDQTGMPVSTRVVNEKALTLYLNSREIVTMMTIGDYPELLAVGYLRNQNMLSDEDRITGVEYDDDLEVVIVRTQEETDYEDKLRKRVQTSGCAQGTVFGEIMDSFGNTVLDNSAKLKTSWLHALLKKINTAPSLYLEAGAIHGCVLCEEDRPLIYMEDVGRHNAVDKISGWMFQNSVSGSNKTFYTTGRLTSEMVIKTVIMGIPILISRSGFTAAGVELAKQAGLTLIGRARGQRFIALAGEHRVEFDAEPSTSESEPDHHRRKGARRD